MCIVKGLILSSFVLMCGALPHQSGGYIRHHLGGEPTRSQQKESTPIVLKHADSLLGRVINGESIREVIGRVEFVQGDVIVRCYRAIHYPSRNQAELFGDVTVIRDTVTLMAPRGVYDGKKRQAFGYDGVRMWNKHLILTAKEGHYLVDDKVAYFKGDVKVVDEATTITAKELIYFEKERKSLARNDVKVVNQRDNSTIFGNYLEHLDDKKQSKILEDPRFVQIDTSSSGKVDTLIITAKQMESFEKPERRFVAMDSVQLVRGELAAKSGEGVYYSQKESIVLRSSPIIWYEDNQITGDSMQIELRDRRLDRVYVSGRAFAVSRSDSLEDRKSPSETRFNQLTSQRMTLYFSDDRLQQIEAEGTAISLYYLYENGVPNGVNKVSGDKIVLVSREGRAESIKVVGGTEGTYYPENLVAGRESSYNLPGFIWRKDRPRLGMPLTIVGLPDDGGGELEK